MLHISIDTLTGSAATTRGTGKFGPRKLVQHIWIFREREVPGARIESNETVLGWVFLLPCRGCLEVVRQEVNHSLNASVTSPL